MCDSQRRPSRTPSPTSDSRERGPNSSCGAGKICTGAALPSLYSYCAGLVVTPDAGATDAGTPDATP